MFSFVSLSVLALAASAVSGLAIPRAAAAAPANWSNSLEDYATYHSRYLAIGCQNKHDTSFFDQCCHPVSKGSHPDPDCASPEDDADDEDCEDDDAEDDKPTTTVAPAPTPKPTPKPAPAPAKPAPAPAKPAPAPADNGSSGNVSGGFATFFYQGGVAGACGKVHGDGDLVAAMDSRRYGNTSVRSPLCGRRIQITNPKNGKSVIVTVADACPTCENRDSIDLSVGAFKKIATEAEGMVRINWHFV